MSSTLPSFAAELPASKDRQQSTTSSGAIIEEDQGKDAKVEKAPEADGTDTATPESEASRKSEESSSSSAERQALTNGGTTKILDDRSITKNVVPKVDEATGALSFSYPIMLPPGRNGMQPDLSLQYNSQDKNIYSPYGYGWSISIPYIKRYQPTGALNQYSTNTYEFSLGGKLILSAVQPEDGTKAFETRMEQGQNWKLILGQDDVWTARDNSGHIYRFGQTAASRQDNPSWGSYMWMVSEITDTNNNAIRYSYIKQSGQIYPDRINYTYHPEAASIYEVQFQWLDATYPRTSYQSGFKVMTEKRLSKIVVLSNNQTIHQYTLGFQPSISNVVYLVSYIREEYANAAGTLVSKPDLTFEYPATSEVSGFTEISDFQFPLSYIDYGVRFGEFTGDGLTDFMYGSSLYVNNGNGWSGGFTPTNGPSVSNPMSGYNDTYEMGDFNFDGILDYFSAFGNVSTNPANVHNSYFYLNGSNGYQLDPSSPQTPPQVTTGNCYFSPPCDHAGLRLLDLNADGLLDMLQGFRFTRYNGNMGGYYDTYINRLHLANPDGTGKMSWQENTWSILPVFEYEASGSVQHQIMEMNGDGLPDLIYFNYFTDSQPRYSIFDYHINNTISWQHNSGVGLPSEAGTPTTKRVADINGDGLDDLVVAANFYSNTCYSDCNHIRRVFLGYGDSFIESSDWTLPDSAYFMNAPTAYSIDTNYNPHAALADINGDGAQDLIVLEKGVNGHNSIYLNKSAYAYLPKTIRLPEGGSLDISYKGSPQYRTDSGQMVNQIPFVVTTVEKVTTNDGNGNVGTDTYFYENGTYVPRNAAVTNPRFMLERSMSFGKVTHTRPDGSKMISYYHQGNGNATNEINDDIVKAGKMYRQESYGSNGTLLKAVASRWDKDDLTGASDTGHWFVKQSSVVTLDYGTGASHKDSAVSYSYDPQTFMSTGETVYGEVNGNIDGSFNDTGTDKRSMSRTFVNNNIYLSSLKSSETTTDQNGNKTAETRYYYDTQALGQASFGNLTRQENWISGTTYASGQKGYNNLGLPTSETDPRGFTTSFLYDSAKLYPASSTNALNQTTQYLYHYPTGKVRQMTDANGAVFITSYDVLGRITQEQIPDPVNGTSVTKSTYTYTETPNSFSSSQTNYLDASISVQTASFADGLGRVVQVRKQAEGSNFVVSDSIYDNTGRILKQSLPYFSTGSARTPASATASLYTTFTYDGLDRTLSETNTTGTQSSNYAGWTTSVTDRNGNVKDMSRDAFNRIASVVEHNQGQNYTTTYSYDSNDQLIHLTDTSGNIRRFTYDGLGRRLSAEDLHAAADTTFGVWNFSYDAAGNMTSKVSPKNETTNYTYDSLNRILTEDFTGQPGTEISYGYDNCTNGIGRKCLSNSAAVNETFLYNQLGQVTENARTINTIQYKTSSIYDRQGNAITVTNPDNSILKNIFINGGLLNQVQRKEAADTNFTNVIANIDYSPIGQETIISYGNGTTTTNTYDDTKLYRLVHKVTTTPSAQGSASNIASSKGSEASTLLKQFGDLLVATVIPPAPVPTISPNGGYFPTSQTVTLSTSLVGATIRYTINGNTPTVASKKYTDPFTITSTTTVRAITVKTGYSNSNEATATFTKGQAPQAPVITSFTATPASLTTGQSTTLAWTLSGGTPTSLVIDQNVGSVLGSSSKIVTPNPTTTYKLTATNTVGSVSAQVTVNVTAPAIAFGPTLQDITYTYDAVGNITKIVDASQTRAAKTVNYTYDALNRLLSATATNAASGQQNYTDLYTYDALGNILTHSQTLGTAPAVVSTYTYLGHQGTSFANPHAATTITTGSTPVSYGYDKNGNLVTEGTKTYSWNYRNELTGISGGSLNTSYAYDPSGQRVKNTSGALTTIYPSAFYNTDSSGKVTKHLGAATVEGSGAGASVYYNHSDHLSGQGVTTNQAGSAVEVMDYYPFGANRLDDKKTGFSEQRKFTGHEYDADTTLLYADARYYNSLTARFISEDQAFWAVGDSNQLESITGSKTVYFLSDPQNLNSYSYARNNPLINLDPDGNATYHFNDGRTEQHGVTNQNFYEQDDINTLQNNATYMEQHRGNVIAFTNMVRPGGKWDYKTQDRFFFYNGKLVSSEVFGNINFGYTGAAGGISPGVLKDAAGMIQVAFSKSYGHDPSNNYDAVNDTPNIQIGIDDYLGSHSNRSTTMSGVGELIYQNSSLPNKARNITSIGVAARDRYQFYRGVWRGLSALYNSFSD